MTSGTATVSVTSWTRKNERVLANGLHAPADDHASLVAAIVVYCILAAAGASVLAVALLAALGFGL